MKYTLVYTKRAVQDIEALDRLAKKRIGNKIIQLQDDPLQKSKKLINSKIGTYRFRIGDYRVVFDVDKDRVVILRIGHRGEIYR